MENNKIHILIVDDDDRIRSLLKEYLVENNYIVSTSENAENAKKKLKVFKLSFRRTDWPNFIKIGSNLRLVERLEKF